MNLHTGGAATTVVMKGCNNGRYPRNSLYSDCIIEEKAVVLQKKDNEGFGFVLRGAKGMCFCVCVCVWCALAWRNLYISEYKQELFLVHLVARQQDSLHAVLLRQILVVSVWSSLRFYIGEALYSRFVGRKFCLYFYCDGICNILSFICFVMQFT